MIDDDDILDLCNILDILQEIMKINLYHVYK